MLDGVKGNRLHGGPWGMKLNYKVCTSFFAHVNTNLKSEIIVALDNE